MDEQKRIVLSGIRPTADDLHLGNYLGAIRYFAELSNDSQNDCFFFVADLHALTTCGTEFDAEGIRRGRRAIVLNLLAAGVDRNSTFYAQSSIPELTELAWILACFSRVNALQAMHHWADKREALAKNSIEANAGLLTYPVLMAADILGPRSDIVPVGHDQKQHVEFARDLARAFNAATKSNLFPIPGSEEHEDLTIKALDTPSDKMGKSSPNGCIFMNDDPEVIKQKFARAVTDVNRKRRSDPGNPSNCNIFHLHQLLSSGETIAWAQTGCQSAYIGCLECKENLSTTVVNLLAPIREERRKLEASGDACIDEFLNEGGRKARTRIQETVRAAKELMGLTQSAWR